MSEPDDIADLNPVRLFEKHRILHILIANVDLFPPTAKANRRGASSGAVIQAPVWQ